MAEDRMAVEINEGRTEARITFLPASGVSGVLTLSQDQLLILIQSLGTAHQAMAESKEIPPLEGKQIQAYANIRWFVQPELLGEASVLSFYHPAFGPLGFLIPIDQTEQMSGLLARQVELAKQSRGGKAH